MEIVSLGLGRYPASLPFDRAWGIIRESELIAVDEMPTMEGGNVSEVSVPEFAGSRVCLTCGVSLMGAFGPRITLTMVVPAASENQQDGELKVAARSWICPGCGLVHWYAEDEHLGPLLNAATNAELLTGEPGQSYERRAHMLRMLRRVRRL